jgi:hypothetical protein
LEELEMSKIEKLEKMADYACGFLSPNTGDDEYAFERKTLIERFAKTLGWDAVIDKQEPPQ